MFRLYLVERITVGSRLRIQLPYLRIATFTFHLANDEFEKTVPSTVG